MRAVVPVAFWLVLLATVQMTYGQGVSPAAATTRAADTGLQRYEVGLQAADLQTECVGEQGCSIPSFGLGVGWTLNLNPHFALDTNLLTTPADSNGSTNEYGGHATELLAGLRAEARARRYGFFLKAQPGFFDWSKVITQVDTSGFPITFTFGHRTHFVSDVGAGFEYSPTARVHIRADLSDLVLRYSGSSWANNFQPSMAVYYGLGRSIAWKRPIYDPKKAHRFGSSTNLVLLTGSLLSTTTDAITTQRFLAHGGHEDDPLARPLVKYGWSGQISLIVLEMGSEVAGMYGLHRVGQHLAERLVPVSLAAIHGYLAYDNLQSR